MKLAIASIWPGLLLCAGLGLGTAGCELIDEWYGTDDDFAGDAPGPSQISPPAEADPTQAGGAATGSGVAPAGPMQGIYKFTDNKGVIHYVDSIHKVPKRYRKRAINPTGGSYTIVPATPVDELLEKQGIDAKDYEKKGPSKSTKHGQVILYSTTWCPYCTKAADYLRKRGVAFVTKDVGKSRSALQEMLAKSGGSRGVPVIDVHGNIIRGFNPRAVDAALAR